MTPWELDFAVTGAARRDTALAWRIANLSRAERLPRLVRLLGDQDPDDFTEEEFQDFVKMATDDLNLRSLNGR